MRPSSRAVVSIKLGVEATERTFPLQGAARLKVTFDICADAPGAVGVVQDQVERRQHDREWHIVQGYWDAETAAVLRKGSKECE